MIVLDTNVVSEPTKPQGNGRVLAWLDQQNPEWLYLTTTSLSEILLGVELLPPEKRKEGLSSQVERLLRKYFSDRILAFDQEAAIACASIVAQASKRGFAISTPDGQIAAIAAVHGFTVATRDTATFLAAGVPVLNPWQE
jgi:predicted nucleic acid-binding protein